MSPRRVFLFLKLARMASWQQATIARYWLLATSLTARASFFECVTGRTLCTGYLASQHPCNLLVLDHTTSNKSRRKSTSSQKIESMCHTLWILQLCFTTYVDLRDI